MKKFKTLEVIEQNGISYLAIPYEDTCKDTDPYERIKYIKKVVSLMTGIVNFDMATRKREVVRARQLAQFFAWLIYNYEKSETDIVFSLADIGRKTGYKDHATVLHSVKAVSASFNTYPAEKELIIEIARQLDCIEKLERYFKVKTNIKSIDVRIFDAEDVLKAELIQNHFNSFELSDFKKMTNFN